MGSRDRHPVHRAWQHGGRRLLAAGRHDVPDRALQLRPVSNVIGERGATIPMSALNRMPATPRRSLLARLRASNDGIAAIEFAYLAPVMLLMFAGAFELSRAI